MSSITVAPPLSALGKTKPSCFENLLIMLFSFCEMLLRDTVCLCLKSSSTSL